MTDEAASRGGWAAAAAALVVAVALFFAPALAGRGQFLYRDAGRHYYPEKLWLARELARGHFPQWNPLVGLGAPVVAGGISGVQHPLNVLFLALPFDRAFTLWVVGCYLLATLGAMAWGRALGLGPPAAAVAGAAFGLSGFLVSSSDNLIHLATMAGAPWLLAASRAHQLRGGRHRLALVAVASFLCAAGGEALDWAVALALGAAQALLPEVEPPGRRARRALAGAVAAALGAGPVILPFLAFLAESSRSAGLSAEEAGRWNLHPLRLAELALPHLSRGPFGSLRNPVYQYLTGDRMPVPWTLSLYAGASTLALAALGAARSAAARWLLAGAALLAWAAMGHQAGFGWLAARLPVLSGVRYFERLAGWPTLLLAMAAALGAERLLADRPAGRRLALAGAVAAAVALAASAGLRVLAGAGGAGMAVEPRRALVANLVEGLLSDGVFLAALAALAFAMARGRLARGAPAALGLLVALDLAGANVRAYVLAPAEVVLPAVAPIPERLAADPGLGRVTAPFALERERWPELLPFESSWRWGARTAASSFHLAFGVASFDAYAGVVPGRVDRFLRRVGLAGQAVPAGLLGVGTVVVPHRLERALEVGLAPPWRVAAADAELPAWLLEVPHRPRAYLAGELVGVDEEGALEFLARADPRREARTAVEGSLPPGYAPPGGAARVIADAPERVEVAVESDGPGLLVLDDQVLRGWRAEVDGRPAPILAANFLARGVWVGPGRHQVVFRYRTPLWMESWLALLAGLSALAVPWPRRRSRAPPREAPARPGPSRSGP